MEVASIPEHKRFAIGLSQVEFEREFVNRFPACDVIPEVNEWLNTPAAVYRDISAINADDINPAMDGLTPNTIVEEKIEAIKEDTGQDVETQICTCGKKFIPSNGRNKWIGFLAHQRKCKAHLEKR